MLVVQHDERGSTRTQARWTLEQDEHSSARATEHEHDETALLTTWSSFLTCPMCMGMEISCRYLHQHQLVHFILVQNLFLVLHAKPNATALAALARAIRAKSRRTSAAPASLNQGDSSRTVDLTWARPSGQ